MYTLLLLSSPLCPSVVCISPSLFPSLVLQSGLLCRFNPRFLISCGFLFYFGNCYSQFLVLHLLPLPKYLYFPTMHPTCALLSLSHECVWVHILPAMHHIHDAVHPWQCAILKYYTAISLFFVSLFRFSHFTEPRKLWMGWKNWRGDWIFTVRL